MIYKERVIITMAKKWTMCTHCRYISECEIGQVRAHNIKVEPLISSDIGCSNYDHYYTFFNSRQLKLFKKVG